MPLTHRSRTALYHGLSELIDDDQAVEEMLSYFPTRDDDEPISKEFLRAEMSELRAEMSELRSDLHSEVSTLRTQLHGEISALRVEMHDGFRRMAFAFFGSMVSFAGILIGAATILT